MSTRAVTMSRDGRRELDPMSTARHRAGGVCVDGHRFLVVGGLDGYSDNRLSSCEFYDAGANPPQWKPFPIDMPSGRYGCGVASVGGKVYVMGGYDGRYLDDLISIDVSGGDLSALDGRSWETLAPMNQKRGGFACASDADSDLPCIYVFGGWGEDGRILDTAEKYNIGTDTWESLPKMPDKRRFCAAGKVGNKIFVVGGEDGINNPLSSTLVFDISTRRWDSAPAVPEMKTKRTGLSVVVVDGYVVANGGDADADSGGSTMEILDARRNIWVESRARTNHSAFHSTAGFLSGTKEIVVAGAKDSARSESIPFNDVISVALSVPSHRVGGRNDETKNTDDHLGYGEYADALVEVVKNIEESGGSNFAVGLMASWGVGKTKLWYLIKDRIKQDDDKLREDEVKHGTTFDMPDGFTDVYLGFDRWYSRALGKKNTTVDEENQEVDCNEGEKYDAIAALVIAVSFFPLLILILLRFAPTKQGSTTQENVQINVFNDIWDYIMNKLEHLAVSIDRKIKNDCAGLCIFIMVLLLLLPFVATGLVVLLAVPFAFPVVYFHIILKDIHVQKQSKNLKATSAEKVASREVWNRLHGHNSNPIMLWTRLSFFTLPVLFRVAILLAYWITITILRSVMTCLFYAAVCCFGQCFGQRILGQFKFVETAKPHRKKHIFVEFNAWVYNGSDVLWASLVLETLKAVEVEYPSHAYKLYKLKSKLADNLIKPEDDIRMRMNKMDYAFKRFCAMISLSLLLAIGLIAYGSIVLVNNSDIESKNGTIGGITTLITGSLSLVTVSCRIFANLSGFLVNPTEQLLNKAIASTGTQGHDFASSSGFMGQVKKEMGVLSKFLQTEPLIYKGNYRAPQLSICVDDLDRCGAETVVQVLRAVNLLLEGDGEKTFWLAIDPQIVVSAINEGYGEHLRKAGVDGADFLDKIIQLPFCIPRMNAKNKKDFLARIFLPKSELSVLEISARYQAFKHRMEQQHNIAGLGNRFKDRLTQWDCKFQTIDQLNKALKHVGCTQQDGKKEKEAKFIAMEFIRNLESLESQIGYKGALKNIASALGVDHGGGSGSGGDGSSDSGDGEGDGDGVAESTAVPSAVFAVLKKIASALVGDHGGGSGSGGDDGSNCDNSGGGGDSDDDGGAGSAAVLSVASGSSGAGGGNEGDSGGGQGGEGGDDDNSGGNGDGYSDGGAGSTTGPSDPFATDGGGGGGSNDSGQDIGFVTNKDILGPEEWFWINSMLPHFPEKGRKMKKIVNVYAVSKQIIEKRLKLKGGEDWVFRRKLVKAIVLAEMWPQRMAWILQVAATSLLEDGLKRRGGRMRGVNLNELVRKRISLRGLPDIAAQGSIQSIFEKLPLAELYHEIVEPLMHSASNTDEFSSEEVNLEAFKFLLEEFDKELGDELFLSDVYPSEGSKRFNLKTLRPFIFNMQGYYLDRASYQMSQIIIHCDANTMENWEIKWERKSDRYAL